MSDFTSNTPQTLDDVTLIVPAAGVGSRMSAAKPKQYLSVYGKPILAHTLEKLFQLNPKKIVLVVSAEDSEYVSIDLVEQCEIVIGGASRAASVANGLDSLNCHDNDWVMVHDCARPCVRVADILMLYTRLRNTEVGGILAVPVSDTIKKITTDLATKSSKDALKMHSDESINISATLDRSQLWLAQTPQMFRFGLLKRALNGAVESAVAITDEASAIEALGYAAEIIEGHKDNIKITTPEDLAYAAFILSGQELNN